MSAELQRETQRAMQIGAPETVAKMCEAARH
jgi:hypothetical protein